MFFKRYTEKCRKYKLYLNAFNRYKVKIGERMLSKSPFT